MRALFSRVRLWWRNVLLMRKPPSAICTTLGHVIKPETEFQRLIVESGMPFPCERCGMNVYADPPPKPSTRWNT